MKKSFKFILLFLIIIILLVACYFLFIFNQSDSKKFSNEYKSVSNNNVFVYKNTKEIIKILENGTGIVYLGFPECPWCQAYVKYLNEVAISEDVEKIYYCNIFNDRKNNSNDYKKIISLLGKNIRYDEEGNKRIFVPYVAFVLDGKIVDYDDETSVIDKDITPNNYWTKNKVNSLKNKLSKLINEVDSGMCTNCNK